MPDFLFSRHCQKKNRLRSQSYSRRRGLQHVVTCRLQGHMSQLDDVFDDVDRHHHRYVICERFSADHLREQFAALHASGEKSSVLSFHTLTLSTRSLLITRCCNTANQRPHHCCHLANNVEYVDYSRRQVRACPAFILSYCRDKCQSKYSTLHIPCYQRMCLFTARGQ